MMKNRIFSFLLVSLLLLSLLSFSAFAQEVPEQSDLGTITVTVPPEKGEISGSVILIRVADVTISGSACNFEYTQDFSGMDIPLDDLNSQELVAALAVYAVEHDVDLVIGELEDNCVVFGAEAGLYLVAHTDYRTSEITFVPFLVSLPTIQDGEFSYDVIARPKTGPAPEEPTEPAPEEPTEPSPTVPPSETLPQTGQMNWPVPLLAVAGLILFTAGWLLRFREREDKYDA